MVLEKYHTSGKKGTASRRHEATLVPAPMTNKRKIAKRRVRSVTAELLGKRLGLSQSTVSRAFTDAASIHPETRERVIKEAHLLGYQPNILARSLITRRTNIIAVVMASLIDPFYPLVLDELAQRIQSSGLQVLLFIIPPGKHVDDVLPSLLQYKVDAILIASATVSSRVASVCAAQQIPVVLFNRYIPGLKVAAICCDNVAGGRAVAEYLYDTAHVRPAYVDGERDATTNLDRARGFTERLAELGVALHAHEVGGAFSYDAGYKAAGRLVRMNIRPDSIFFASDVMAVGGIDAIRAANLRVPHDISVIGFDDVPMANWPAYALTTVRQPVAQMVDETAKILGFDKSAIKKPSRTIHFMKGRLIERTTVMNRHSISGLSKNAPSLYWLKLNG
jgi:DNA-binding LacI/PurR family transcriptional regulator